MKNLLAICCLIAAALFFGATQANLCEELSPRAGNGTAVDFVDLWVNECFALYSTASWGTYFATINETSTTRFAHLNFYGSIIGCDTVDPANFVASGTNMSDVHSGLTIPAADFVDYVELTRQALQTVVVNTTVAEITEFYQIFQTFRESNTSICNQEDCPSQVPIVISGDTDLANISIGYVATSATTLTVDNSAEFDVELYSVAANATDCDTEAVKLISLAPKALGQTVDLTFAASGVYYVFQRAAAECYASTSLFDSRVLVVDYTLVEVAPVEAPLVEPVAAPVVENTTAPVAINSTAPIAEVPLAPVNETEPIAAPIEVPATEPVAAPVDAPVAEPVATPVEEPIAVPVDEPVSAPISAPAQDGNITPTVGEEGSFEAGGYIAGIVILVLIVIGLLIAVIVMGVKLRRNNTVVVA